MVCHSKTTYHRQDAVLRYVIKNKNYRPQTRRSAMVCHFKLKLQTTQDAALRYVIKNKNYRPQTRRSAMVCH